MRKQLWYLGFVVAICFLQSCTSNSVFEESQTLGSNLIWRNDQPVYFNIPELSLEGKDSTLSLTLKVRHAYHMPKGNIPLKIIILKDESPIQNIDFVCHFKDNKGDVLGEALGDIVDITLPVDQTISYLGKGMRLKIYPLVEERGFAGLMELGINLHVVKD